MRVGVGIVPEDGWREAQRKWRAAEAYGFDHAWTSDHLGWRSLIGEPWFAAVPTLAMAATVTERIGLGASVASPNFRHPVPFARELITLDEMSEGRLTMGIGPGPAGVYDAEVLGTPELTARQRIDRYAEFVDVLDGLLRTDGYDHRGEYYTAVGARNRPGCVQRPRVPFVLAAEGPRGMRVVARHGQGWITNGSRGGIGTGDMDQWWKGVAERVGRFDDALAAAGRPSAEVARQLSLTATPAYQLTGVEVFRDAVGRAGELGFTDVIIPWPRPTDPYAGDESVLEQVAAEVLPELRAPAG